MRLTSEGKHYILESLRANYLVAYRIDLERFIQEKLWKGNYFQGTDLLTLYDKRNDVGACVMRGPADSDRVIRVMHELGIIKPCKFCPGPAAPWIGVMSGNMGSHYAKSHTRCETYWSWEVLYDLQVWD